MATATIMHHFCCEQHDETIEMAGAPSKHFGDSDVGIEMNRNRSKSWCCANGARRYALHIMSGRGVVKSVHLAVCPPACLTQITCAKCHHANVVLNTQ